MMMFCILLWKRRGASVRVYNNSMTTRRVKGLWRNFLLFLAVLGPGIITGSVDNDAGGIATYSIAGAHFGYGFVWAVVPMIVVLVIVQEMNARMGAVTGKGLADLIRENYGAKVTFYAMLALLFSNIGNTITEFSGVAASLEIFGISKYVSVPLAAVFVWLLVLKGTYKIVEKVFLVASLLYVSYIISGFMSGPSWGEVAGYMVSPNIEMDTGYLYMLIGMIGTTIAPWMSFYMQASVVEKGIDISKYAHSVWDVVIGCVMSGVVVFFIIIACAATIYPVGGRVETAADAALALAPLAGKHCSWLFAFGLFNASIFAASVLPLSVAYYVCEGLGWEAGVNKTFSEAPQFYGLYTVTIVLGALIVLVPNFPFLTMMVLTQVINGVLLPFVLIFMLLLINNKEIMGKYVNGKLWNTISWVAVVGIIFLTIMMFVTIA